jgi:hypothetical protein
MLAHPRATATPYQPSDWHKSEQIQKTITLLLLLQLLKMTDYIMTGTISTLEKQNVIMIKDMP